jgi:hypothetical protein
MTLLSHRTFTKKITCETKEISCALYLNKKYEEIASQRVIANRLARQQALCNRRKKQGGSQRVPSRTLFTVFTV